MATKHKTKSTFRIVSLAKIRAWRGLLPLFIFLITAIPTGTYLVFNVPAMWAPDGGAHVARVFQIAEGGVRPVFINHEHGGGYGGNIPLNVIDLKNLELGFVGQSPAGPGQETTSKILTSQDKQQIALVSSQKISKKVELISYVNSAAYSPVAYAPSVIGVYTGIHLNLNLGHTLLLAQMLGFGAFILCAGYGLYTLRNSQLKWVVFVVSLLPVVVFQSSTITADSFLISVSILFGSIIIKGLSANEKLTILDKVLLFICVLLLPLIKSVYFLLVFLILIFPRRHWKTSLGYWIPVASSLVVSMIGFGIWSDWTNDVALSNGLVRGDMQWTYGDANVQRHFVLTHPLGYLHALVDSMLYGSKFYMDTLFGWFGFTYLPIPGLSEVTGYLSLGLSFLLVGKVKFQKHVSSALLVAVTATALAIFTALYVYYTPPRSTEIQGVQGRYFLPLIILTIPALASLFPNVRIKEEGVDTAKIILVAMMVFCTVFAIYRYGLAIS